jgi:conjugative transposon TraN protein
MKKTMLFAVIVMTAFHTYAQKLNLAAGVKKSELPVVYLPANVSLHFISPGPIEYVDISTKNILGDLPVKNILRIKSLPDSAVKGSRRPDSDAVVTIVGEKYIAQYRVVFSPPDGGAVETDIEILPGDTQPVDFPGISLSQQELKNYAAGLIAKKPEKHLQHDKAFGIRANLNHIYTLGDYIFLDLSYDNSTRLKYEIDELRFKIEDKKITKATTVQSYEIKPDLALFDVSSFKKHYRNIFVFKKFTFPGNKVLHVELNEKQLSGRVINLEIPYQDVLEADMIPLP